MVHPDTCSCMGITTTQGKPVPVVHATMMFQELRENIHQRGDIDFSYLFRSSLIEDLRIIKYKHA